MYIIRTAYLFVILTIISGLLYPFAVTFVSNILFPWQANGGIVTRDNQVLGAKFIGQYFVSDKYFWGRPSATVGFAYNGLGSSGSNLPPASPVLLKTVKERIKFLQTHNPTATQLVPADLVFASGSGLDPDISVAAALYQVERVAKARGLTPEIITELVINNITPPTLKVFGERRVNVLALNSLLEGVKNAGNT